jgi:hypothetical protein
MDIKGLIKKSPVSLALFLLVLLFFYLSIKILGYTFIPLNGLAANIFTAGIIIWLTINGMKNRSEKPKATAVFAAILPLISLIYLAFKSVSSDISGESHGLFYVYLTGKSTLIYVIHACITLACSMIVFFSCGRRITVKIGLGIIYSIIMLFVCFLFFVMLIFSDFGKNTVIKSEMSPNSIYLAEVIDNDQGALGGATLVNITQQNRDINLLIGKLKKNPKQIYYGRWGESFEMNLRWETDEILYINEKRYLVE